MAKKSARRVCAWLQLDSTSARGTKPYRGNRKYYGNTGFPHRTLPMPALSVQPIGMRNLFDKVRERAYPVVTNTINTRGMEYMLHVFSLQRYKVRVCLNSGRHRLRRERPGRRPAVDIAFKRSAWSLLFTEPCPTEFFPQGPGIWYTTLTSQRTACRVFSRRRLPLLFLCFIYVPSTIVHTRPNLSEAENTTPTTDFCANFFTAVGKIPFVRHNKGLL